MIAALIGAALFILGAAGKTDNFFCGFGAALFFSEVFMLLRFVRYKNDAEYARKVTVRNTDERNLHSPEIMELFKKNNVVILAGDWTNKNPQITKELEKFGRAGVPLNLLYSRKDPDAPQVLPAILTKSLIIDAVDKIR